MHQLWHLTSLQRRRPQKRRSPGPLRNLQRLHTECLVSQILSRQTLLSLIISPLLTRKRGLWLMSKQRMLRAKAYHDGNHQKPLKRKCPQSPCYCHPVRLWLRSLIRTLFLVPPASLPEKKPRLSSGIFRQLGDSRIRTTTWISRCV